MGVLLCCLVVQIECKSFSPLMNKLSIWPQKRRGCKFSWEIKSVQVKCCQGFPCASAFPRVRLKRFAPWWIEFLAGGCSSIGRYLGLCPDGGREGEGGEAAALAARCSGCSVA